VENENKKKKCEKKLQDVLRGKRKEENI